MSDRDELAHLLEHSDPEGGSLPDECEAEFSYWYPQADAIIAAGWRKKPSREALIRHLANAEVIRNWVDGEWEMPNVIEAERMADAILALMDGGSDDR